MPAVELDYVQQYRPIDGDMYDEAVNLYHQHDLPSPPGSPDYGGYVVTSGRHVVAAVHGRNLGETVLLDRLVVDEAYRGSGIGKLILGRAALALADYMEACSVWFKPSYAAEGYYEKMGFRMQGPYGVVDLPLADFHTILAANRGQAKFVSPDTIQMPEC